MKIIYLFTILVFTTNQLWSQSPELFKYQAVARDNSGNILAEETIEITINILSRSISGTSIFNETHTIKSNAFGLVILNIGANNQEDFGMIDWHDGPYFIEISMNGEIMGTSQLLSVPYALHANTADSVVEEKDPHFKGSIAANITAEDTTAWNNKLDNETQNLNAVLINGNDAQGKQIENLGDPIEDQDAATKAYVDALIDDLSARDVILKDIEGNLYSIERIGGDTWMTENLRTTQYNDGTPIPLVSGSTEWSNLNSPAYCWYENDISHKEDGAIYNWYTVNMEKLCPSGWRVPSQTDWDNFFSIIGGYAYSDLEFYGLSVQSTGQRSAAGDFYKSFAFWTSTEYSASRGISVNQTFTGMLGISNSDKENGLTVRCIKN
ncbi:MAG: FISUMP domain-containing protein [Candidatus Cyclobacteriaceae bacterium M3_2C_046]